MRGEGVAHGYSAGYAAVTIKCVTPEGFHLHSPTLPAEARRRATWGYPDPHMTTPEEFHLVGAAK